MKKEELRVQMPMGCVTALGVRGDQPHEWRANTESTLRVARTTFSVDVYPPVIFPASMTLYGIHVDVDETVPDDCFVLIGENYVATMDKHGDVVVQEREA